MSSRERGPHAHTDLVARVLVTGAGGKTGHAVLTALLGRGAPVRALVRDPGRGHALRDELIHGHPGADVEVAVGDQRDAAAVAAALRDCGAVYAIAPNVSPDEVAMGRAIIEACDLAAVDRLVYHSVIHPQLSRMAHHADKARVEELVVESGLRWTILQPNAYLQNLGGYVDALRAGRYEVPYAVDRGSAMVDLRDVAEVAARCLLDHLGVHATFELCGPDEVTPRDIARVAGELVGTEVVAVRLDPADWEAAATDLPAVSRRRLGAMFQHYDRVGSPGDATVLRALLGREPGDLTRVLRGLLAGR